MFLQRYQTVETVWHFGPQGLKYSILRHVVLPEKCQKAQIIDIRKHVYIIILPGNDQYTTIPLGTHNGSKICIFYELNPFQLKLISCFF